MISRPRVAVLAAASVSLLATACSGTDQAATVRRDLSFTEVAADVGLDFQHSAFHWDLAGDPNSMMGGGVCWLDVDADGWLDLFLTNTWTDGEWGRWDAGPGVPTSALYRNLGGTFADVTAGSGVDLPIRGNGCVAADFDLDGHTDLFVTSDRENALFWNQGDGTFTEGGRNAGVDAHGWHTAALVGDLDGDGWPDLFVAGYVDRNSPIEGATSGFPNSHRAVRDLVHLSNGPGPDGRVTFREVGQDLGVDVFGAGGGHEYGLGGAMCDLDGDGDLDLYVANDTNPDRVYENVPVPDGQPDPLGLGFRLVETRGSEAADRDSGMGVATGDFTMDGRFDVFVTNLGPQRHAVHVNATEAGIAFVDGTDGASSVGDVGGDNTGWGASWVDMDLDTDLDLFLANGAVPLMDRVADAQVPQLLSNRSAEGFGPILEDISAEVLVGVVGALHGRGSAVADFDNDGDPDVVINSIGSPVRLLRNDVDGHWLTVALGGFHSGATVTVVLPNSIELVRTILAGSSYLSSEDPRALFGLGEAEAVTELRVRWPDGQETVLRDVAGDRLVRVDHPDGPAGRS